MQERLGLIPVSGRSLEKGMGIMPGEFHEQRNLVGCSLWVCKESHVTEQLTQTVHTNKPPWLYKLLLLKRLPLSVSSAGQLQLTCQDQLRCYSPHRTSRSQVLWLFYAVHIHIIYICILLEIVAVVQSLSHVWLFMIPWTAHTRLPCPSLSPIHCSNLCPLSWWCHPTISSSVIPFPSCPQSFLASGSFPFKTIQGYSLSWQQYSSLYLWAIHQKGGCPKKNLGASLVVQMVKNLPAMQEAGFNPWVGKILWRSTWHPTPVFLPHGQRSPAGYRQWDHKESDMTERLSTHIKEGG